MSGKNSKTTAVTFKVEDELAVLLSQLPNKSEFIRKAIAAQLGVACPLCAGKGLVSRSVHDHYAQVIKADRAQACVGCGDQIVLPGDPGDLAADDRTRLEQFFFGGPLYCETCFEAAPACGDCGWHVDDDHLSEHKHHRHATHK